MNYLSINGFNISEYIKSLDMTHEPVWSTNAGRTLDATFVGDIVARKWTLKVSTRPLTQQESAKINKLIKSSPFLQVSFIPNDSEDDSLKKISAYSSKPSTNVYSYATNIRYSGLDFELIEQ